MFEKLMDTIANLTHESVHDTAEDDLRLATAALLVHASVVDGQVDEVETEKLADLLEARYGLTGAEARRLISQARAKEQDAVDLYGFTKVLARHLDQEGRQRIIEMLWEVVLADGVEHEFESNLVFRVAELLGVSTRDRVLLRKHVEGEI